MDNLIAQLDALLTKYANLRQASQYDDLSDLPRVDRQSLVTRSRSAIFRIAGAQSTYATEVERILEGKPQLSHHTPYIVGIVQALRDDLDDGHLKTLVELVHADVFADFLDMAFHLQNLGYKDAAAVIAGSTLESHIKELCSKFNVPVEVNGNPAKADKLNSDLMKSNAYGKLDQKNVTAWLDLRNKAAHGKYSEYSGDQVELLISGVRNFIGRVPA